MGFVRRWRDRRAADRFMKGKGGEAEGGLDPWADDDAFFTDAHSAPEHLDPDENTAARDGITGFARAAHESGPESDLDEIFDHPVMRDQEEIRLGRQERKDRKTGTRRFWVGIAVAVAGIIVGVIIAWVT